MAKCDSRYRELFCPSLVRLALLAILILMVTVFAADEPKLAARFLKLPDVAADLKDHPGEWINKTLEDVRKEIVPSIQKASKITCHSLDPSEWPNDERRKDPKRFHGWRILGSIEMTSANDLALWRRELIEGVFPGAAVGAFYPHYGVRIDGRTPLDIVACFETCQWWRYSSRLPEESLSHGAALDRTVRERLNKVFDTKGIPRDSTSINDRKDKTGK